MFFVMIALALLLPAIPAAATCYAIGKTGLTGSRRVWALALGTAMWFGPSTFFGPHGDMPISLTIDLITYFMGIVFRRDFTAPGVVTHWMMYLIGTVLLTLLAAFVYRCFFARWSMRPPMMATHHPTTGSA